MPNQRNNSSSPEIEKWPMPSTPGIALSIIFTLVIILSIAAIIYIVTTGYSSESFTEFYILSLNGKADDYPTEVIVNEEVFVVLGIVNREQKNTEYRVEITIDGQLNNEKKPIRLDNNEKWENIIGFIPEKAGDRQKVEFILYRQEQEEPYLSIYLWIDVIQE